MTWPTPYAGSSAPVSRSRVMRSITFPRLSVPATAWRVRYLAGDRRVPVNSRLAVGNEPCVNENEIGSSGIPPSLFGPFFDIPAKSIEVTRAEIPFLSVATANRHSATPALEPTALLRAVVAREKENPKRRQCGRRNSRRGRRASELRVTLDGRTGTPKLSGRSSTRRARGALIFCSTTAGVMSWNAPSLSRRRLRAAADSRLRFSCRSRSRPMTVHWYVPRRGSSTMLQFFISCLQNIGGPGRHVLAPPIAPLGTGDKTTNGD